MPTSAPHRPALPSWRRPGDARLIGFRLVFGLLLAASIGCFAAYIATRRVLWRRRGVFILQGTLLVAFTFFGVLILERLGLLP